MKKINCFLVLLLCAKLTHAQNDLQLHLAVADPASVGFLKQAYVKAVLKNVSAKEISIVHPGFAEPLWYVDKRQWQISFNGGEVKPFIFAERPYKKYTKKNNLVLKPGDSVIAGTYPLEFKEQGNYKIALTYTQLKEKADAVYVDKDYLKNNQDFTVTSAPLEFIIKIKTVTTQSPALPYEVLANKAIAYSFAEALTDPDNTYRLILKGIRPADLTLLQYLKNLQWLELTEAHLDTVPAFLTELKLHYLYYTSAKKNVFFPPVLQNMKTLRSLYLGSMQLDTIPDFVHKLKDLEKLEIRVTQLGRLTPALNCMSNLKELIIFWSLFEKVPYELTLMPSLQRLTLESGELKNIDFLGYMPNLKYVRIAGRTSFRQHPLAQQLKDKGVEVSFF